MFISLIRIPPVEEGYYLRIYIEFVAIVFVWLMLTYFLHVIFKAN